MHNDSSGDILSCVVYAHPGQGPEVAAQINQQPGTEVVAGIAESKLVVTIEDTAASKAADVMAELNAVRGVISTLLIYHCAAEALAESPDRAASALPVAAPSAPQATAPTARRPASPALSPAFSEDSQ